MADGTVVDTEKAQDSWGEATYWDGRNHISKASGSQWDHQTLFKSRKGRYYVLRSSDWQGARNHVEWISDEEATRWLLHNEHKLPADLQPLEDEVTE